MFVLTLLLIGLYVVRPDSRGLYTHSHWQPLGLCVRPLSHNQTDPFFRWTQSAHPLPSMGRQMSLGLYLLILDLAKSAENRQMAICSAFVQWVESDERQTGCPFSSDLPTEESGTLTGQSLHSEQRRSRHLPAQRSDPGRASGVHQNGSAPCERGLNLTSRLLPVR